MPSITQISSINFPFPWCSQNHHAPKLGKPGILNQTFRQRKWLDAAHATYRWNPLTLRSELRSVADRSCTLKGRWSWPSRYKMGVFARCSWYQFYRNQPSIFTKLPCKVIRWASLILHIYHMPQLSWSLTLYVIIARSKTMKSNFLIALFSLALAAVAAPTGMSIVIPELYLARMFLIWW